jgi:isocitrate/isopropylmalate dehydrogenase
MDKAIDTTLEDPKKRTADLGGPLGTQAFAAAVAEKL